MSFARMLESGVLEKKVRSLWKEYEQKPIRSLRHLWRFWRLHREFDFSKPDLSSWFYQFPASRIPDCLHCPDVCCKGSLSTVLLRLVDVALFVDRGWTEHMTLEKPSFSPELLAQRPALQAMVSSFHWKVFPVLRQRADQTCVFLSEQGLCSIHTSRPWVCRTFPYRLDFDSCSIGWASRCQCFLEETNTKKNAEKIPKELHHAVFHNFYGEKIRDLILLQMYPEEIDKMGLGKWLHMDAL